MMKNLKFRRQYILINKSVKIQEGWNNLNFRQNKKNWNLYSHVDLDVLSKKNKKYELILIGYILDPFNPDYDNDQILSNLCLLNSFEEILHKTENYNGRFILIFVNESTIRLFNDATGFREIYHYNKGEIIACGSTPNILSEYIDIDKDSDKEINEFFNSPEFNSPERQWIGTRTIYEGIGHLLPNHYLNLTTNRVVRFWPDKVFKKQKLKNVTEFMADILTGTYKAATRRFKLYQGLTSGWDTRCK